MLGSASHMKFERALENANLVLLMKCTFFLSFSFCKKTLRLS
jgi:hypothetical protein